MLRCSIQTCNLLLCMLQVDRVISEADGYQPHLVAPEMGYRRLLQECLILFKVHQHDWLYMPCRSTSGCQCQHSCRPARCRVVVHATSTVDPVDSDGR